MLRYMYTSPVLLNTHSVAITCVHISSYFYILYHFTLLVYQTAKAQEYILNTRYTVEFSRIKLTLLTDTHHAATSWKTVSVRHTVNRGVGRRQQEKYK